MQELKACTSRQKQPIVAEWNCVLQERRSEQLVECIMPSPGRLIPRFGSIVRYRIDGDLPSGISFAHRGGVMHPAILIYGRDRILSLTRSWVLEQAGYRTRCAFEQSEAQNIVFDERPAAVVVCFSLTEDQRNAFLKAIAQISPGIRCLVFADGWSNRPRIGNVAYIDPFAGPVTLLLQLDTILSWGRLRA